MGIVHSLVPTLSIYSSHLFNLQFASLFHAEIPTAVDQYVHTPVDISTTKDDQNML